MFRSRLFIKLFNEFNLSLRLFLVLSRLFFEPWSMRDENISLLKVRSWALNLNLGNLCFSLCSLCCLYLDNIVIKLLYMRALDRNSTFILFWFFFRVLVKHNIYLEFQWFFFFGFSLKSCVCFLHLLLLASTWGKGKKIVIWDLSRGRRSFFFWSRYITHNDSTIFLRLFWEVKENWNLDI